MSDPTPPPPGQAPSSDRRTDDRPADDGRIDPKLDLEALRAEFPILSERNYLNSCSLGALSRSARAELDRFLGRWDARGAAAWYEEWMAKLDELRGLAGDLHGVTRDETALLPSTSAALSVISESVDDPARRRIVVSELDFPTLPYQWMVKPEYEVVRVPSDDGVTVDPERFAEAVDERTLFLATSHVFYSTGARQDIARLAGIAREAGAWSLIDGYQASGHVPVDVAAAGVDIYTGGPLKWLCGGPGLAYLFVRPDRLDELRPRITSWFANTRQFDFDATEFEYRDDARRFELGTPSLPSVHLALGAHRLLDSVGFETVHARIRALTDHLVDGLAGAGFELSIAPPEARTGIVMVRHPEPAEAVATLEEQGIVVDHRPGHVRVSPHVYNTESEVDSAVRALASTR